MAKGDVFIQDLTFVGILGVIIVSKCWGSHVGSTRVLHNHFAGFEAITDGFGNQLNQIHTFARLASLKKDERESHSDSWPQESRGLPSANWT